MIRLLLFFLFLAGLSFIASWLTANEGNVAIEWLGYHIETSIAFAAFMLFTVVILALFLVYFVVWLINTPKRIARKKAAKKHDRGLAYLTEGIAAVAAGDAIQAKRLAIKTEYNLGEIPLTQWLFAEASALSGNVESIRQNYTALLEHKETELIALKNLLAQARKEGNIDSAIYLAKRTISHYPHVKWAHQILIELYKHTHQWEEAQTAVEDALEKRALNLENSKRISAMLYLVRSIKSLSQSNLENAQFYAKESLKHAPDFPPVITQLAHIYQQQNASGKGLKLIEQSWKTAPHPELASCYLELLTNEKPDKVLKQAEKLASLHPDHIESHKIIAKAAINAGDYNLARNHLKIALGYQETASVCYLMAELERHENNDLDAVQKWNTRASQATLDPAWLCHKCGYITEHWNVSCQQCKSFDSFSWQTNNQIQALTFEVVDTALP